jgi:hypothetical protein
MYVESPSKSGGNTPAPIKSRPFSSLRFDITTICNSALAAEVFSKLSPTESADLTLVNKHPDWSLEQLGRCMEPELTPDETFTRLLKAYSTAYARFREAVVLSVRSSPMRQKSGTPSKRQKKKITMEDYVAEGARHRFRLFKPEIPASKYQPVRWVCAKCGPALTDGVEAFGSERIVKWSLDGLQKKKIPRPCPFCAAASKSARVQCRMRVPAG